MRFSEVLNTIRNKFIRRNCQTQPEGNQKEPDVLETLEVPKKAEPEHEKLVRRYRAYAYHHKKRRIRKKYLKKLVEISAIDRLMYTAKMSGIAAKEMELYTAALAGGRMQYGCRATNIATHRRHHRETPYNF